MNTPASLLLTGIGGGVLAELLLFMLLNRVFRVNGKTAGMIITLLVLLIYVPWAILIWPGADVFATNEHGVNPANGLDVDPPGRAMVKLVAQQYTSR